MALKIERLGAAPILSAGSCARIGDNLNGPSVIEVPDWVQEPLGRFYLYFAHHQGRFIRLAFADAPEGPWRVQSYGVLDVTETPFAHDDLTDAPEGGGDWVRQTGGGFLYAHVASPDVHVDQKAGLIRMYYHGMMPDGEQVTRLALSRDGLRFTDHSAPLGPPYFRVFAHGGWVYAIAWGGALLRAQDWAGPFVPWPDPPGLFQRPPLAGDGRVLRHVAVQVTGDRLVLYFTRIGDAPERIFRAPVTLHADWADWQMGPVEEVLRPQEPWEGAQALARPSRIGTAEAGENGLRDPFVFKSFLYYCGGGEDAIGVVRLKE